MQVHHTSLWIVVLVIDVRVGDALLKRGSDRCLGFDMHVSAALLWLEVRSRRCRV
jgi:hypothetical protein